MKHACPTEDLLHRYRAGACTHDETSAVDDHLTSCPHCRSLLDEDDRSLLDDVRRVIEHDGPLAAPLERTTLGRYRIGRRLGAGGMGVVYEAEQAHPRRPVALKVIRFGASAGKHARRFELEAEALGRLRHPGIAHILEAGTAETDLGPQPFIAMELVEGVRITDFAREHTVDVRRRLELMACVADAVQHAHARGVIHRDLKPSNILVEASGQPRVLDFGLARLIEADRLATLETNLNELVGTVPYMSPEQFTGEPGDLDTRSDVYALGVILYELLAGRLPFEVAGRPLPEIARLIAETEPPALGTLDRALRGDVETIARTALEKDPARRYQSAAALAGDLRRHLADEPIMARRAGTAYTVGKFARRHRVLVAAITIAVLALTGATIVSAISATRADRAARAEAAQRAVADETVVFLSEMLASVDPELAGGEDVLVRDVLEQASARVGDELDSQPLVAAAIRHTIGTTYRALGHFDEAERHLREAWRLRIEHLGAAHHDTLHAVADLGATVQMQGRLEEATGLYTPALEIAERAHGTRDVETLRIMNGLGVVLGIRGQLDASEDLLERALPLSRETAGAEAPDTLSLMHNLAQLRSEQGRLDEAETLFREVLAARSRVHGERHVRTLSSLHNLGMFLSDRGQHDEAAVFLERAMEQRRHLLGGDHRLTLQSMNNLAIVLSRQGALDRSERLYREALERRLATLGPEHPDLISAQANLGRVLLRRGHPEDAEPLLREALALAHRCYGDANRRTLAVTVMLAEVLIAVDGAAEAETMLREALARGQAAMPRHWRLATLEVRLGQALLALGRRGEATPLLHAGLAQLDEQVGPDHEWTRRAAAALAEAGLAPETTPRRSSVCSQ